MDASKKKYKLKMKNLGKWNKGNEVEQIRRYRKKYPKKYLAQTIAGNHIKIEKAKCSICQKSLSKIIKHHPNYSKPFFIIIMCYQCHNKIHSKGGEK